MQNIKKSTTNTNLYEDKCILFHFFSGLFTLLDTRLWHRFAQDSCKYIDGLWHYLHPCRLPPPGAGNITGLRILSSLVRSPEPIWIHPIHPDKSELSRPNRAEFLISLIPIPTILVRIGFEVRSEHNIFEYSFVVLIVWISNFERELFLTQQFQPIPEIH